MSSSTIKSFAKKTGKSEAEVEKLWKQAKSLAKKEYPDVSTDSDRYFAIVTGILKKSLGLKESIKSFSEMVSTGALATNIPTPQGISPISKFRGMYVFDCPAATFAKCVKGKMKGAHWKTFLGKDEFGVGIKTWAAKNPKSAFLFKNSATGAMIFARKQPR